MIGGMTSFSRTIVASVVIGLLQSIVNFNFIDKPGLINLLLLIIVVVAVLFNRERTDESEVFAFTPRARPIPERLQSSRWARNINKSGIFLLGAIAIVLPLIFTQPSTQQTFTEILAFAICATSLTVLTGWLGQLSLGQMAFAGLGALFAARLVEGGVPFWLAIVATTAGSAVLAMVLGLSSLRVKGLYLAVVTFVFALAAQQYFFSLGILSGGSSDGSDLPFVPGKLFSLSFPGQRTYYYVVLVILAVVLLIANRFRDSGIGRSIMAVRDNENAAAAYRVRPVWEKIRAFAIAGALAGHGWRTAERRLLQRRVRRTGQLLHRRHLLEPRGHGGDRWDGLGHGRGHRRHLGHRDSRARSQQSGPRACSRRASGSWRSCSTSPVGSCRSPTTPATPSWPGPIGDSARMSAPVTARPPAKAALPEPEHRDGRRADTGRLRPPGDLRRERRRRRRHGQRERTRDRRAHREQRGRQVDADERDRRLRPGVGLGATRATRRSATSRRPTGPGWGWAGRSSRPRCSPS